MKERILVTGGAGYVGSRFIPLLLQKGYKVRVLDNLMYEQPSLLNYFINPDFEFTLSEITDEKTVKDAMKDVDIVVHLAAIVGAPACQIDPDRARRVNVEGAKLVNKLRGKKPIIYPSTGSVYGKLEDICTEESSVNPLSLYGETKWEAEQAITHSDNYVVYRPATAFGLSQRLRLDLMPNDFTYQAIKNNNLVVYEGSAKRTFLHVYDFARALLYAITHFDEMKNEVYNLGHEDMNCTKREIAEIIQKYHKFYLHFAEFGSDPDKRDYEVSYKKLRTCGFETKITLDEGIQELIRGYKMIHLRNPYSNYQG
jgi:nucleoside-diphosphate-sugar epimerase